SSPTVNVPAPRVVCSAVELSRPAGSASSAAASSASASAASCSAAVSAPSAPSASPAPSWLAAGSPSVAGSEPPLKTWIAITSTTTASSAVRILCRANQLRFFGSGGGGTGPCGGTPPVWAAPTGGCSDGVL